MTRITRSLFVVLLLLVVLPSWVQAATYYMRPYATGPYGDSSGSSYVNAFRAWNANTLPAWNPGDRLIICGVVGIHPSDVTGFMNMGANEGSAASHIVITGLCPEEAGTLGTLTGGNTLKPVLRITFSYVDLEDINVTNSQLWVDDYVDYGAGVNADCVIVSSAGGGLGFNIVSRVRTSECSGVGINVQKPSVIVQDSVVTKIGIDGIIMSSAASGTIIRRNIVSDFARHNSLADGIETTTATTGDILIEYNTVTFQNYYSTKSGIIGGGTAPGVTTIRFNTVISPDLAAAVANPTPNNGISWTAGQADIYGNTVYGFYAGLSCFNVGVAHTTVNMYNNVVSNNYFAIRLAPSVGTPTFNLYNNTAATVSYGISDGHTVSNTINAYNNVITLLNPQSLGAIKGYALSIATGTTYNGNNNDFYPEGTDFMRNQLCAGGPYATLAAYKAACPTVDMATISADPLFVSTSDYRTRGTSPIRNTGIVKSWCRDPRNRMCRDDRRDIGAYQSSSGDQAATRAARQ